MTPGEQATLVLCERCLAGFSGQAAPTGMYSVDGCDLCEDGGAGHQVFEVTYA